MHRRTQNTYIQRIRPKQHDQQSASQCFCSKKLKKYLCKRNPILGWIDTTARKTNALPKDLSKHSVVATMSDGRVVVCLLDVCSSQLQQVAVVSLESKSTRGNLCIVYTHTRSSSLSSFCFLEKVVFISYHCKCAHNYRQEKKDFSKRISFSFRRVVFDHLIFFRFLCYVTASF